MSHHANAGPCAGEAVRKLREGNARYLTAQTNQADISQALRLHTCQNGQSPYAVIVTCSDSRVIPESIFSAGIGELFVVRVAGNVIDRHQLGSIEYAVRHLGTRLIVVMGHTRCGAVGAAIAGSREGFITSITEEIRLAIGQETDDYRAACLNVAHSVARIQDSLPCDNNDPEAVHVIGAMYHIDTGEAEFL